MNIQKGFAPKSRLTKWDGSGWCMYAWLLFTVLSIIIGSTLFIEFPVKNPTDGVVSTLALTFVLFGYALWLNTSLPAIKNSMATPQAFPFFELRCFIVTLILFLLLLFLRVQLFYLGASSVV